MTRSIRGRAVFVLAAVLMPIAAQASLFSADPVPSNPLEQPQLALGGGRGGGGVGGGGNRGGAGNRVGGGTRGGLQRPQGNTGFQGASSSLNRGDRTPTGGWSQRVPPSAARPEISRPSGSRDLNRDSISGVNRPASGTRDINRDLNRGGSLDLNRDINRNVNRDLNRDVNRTINRNWGREVNINNINVNPGWARAGWGVARPWNHGWYGGWNNPPWGWWGARAAVWGIGSLATAAVINDAVNDAINDQVSYIVVPSTSYQLIYGSVAPVGNQSVSFAVTADGSTYQLTADCQTGTLNGNTPSSAAEAQLLNAACQVAFGNA